MKLAEEFMDRDLLSHFSGANLYQRLLVWQVVMILFTLIVSNDRFGLIFGTDMYPGDSYQDQCPVEFAKIKENGNAVGAQGYDTTLEDPTDITTVLYSYLFVHIVDIIFY